VGTPARRIEANPFERRSNHLRLVETPPAVAAAPVRKRPARTAKAPAVVKVSAQARARERAAEARARAAFMTFIAVFACVIVLGGARLTLLVQASEASVVESRVQSAMKTQSAEVAQLAADKSALSTPSRIAGIASSSMGMGEPAAVRYISLSGQAAGADAAANGVSATPPQDLVGRVFNALVQLSAGEAQSLLVGDVGLAGAR
jgi:cell division protein FtsL